MWIYLRANRATMNNVRNQPHSRLPVGRTLLFDYTAVNVAQYLPLPPPSFGPTCMQKKYTHCNNLIFLLLASRHLPLPCLNQTAYLKRTATPAGQNAIHDSPFGQPSDQAWYGSREARDSTDVAQKGCVDAQLIVFHFN